MKSPVKAKVIPFDDKVKTKGDWSWDDVFILTTIERGRDGRELMARRHILRLKEEHVGVLTLSMGVIHAHDVGRALLVDAMEDGTFKEYLVEGSELQGKAILSASK